MLRLASTPRWLPVLYLLIAVTSLANPVLAEERITRYHSEVNIHPNAELTVTETIEVNAEGKNIRRGIYRDFPTRYKDRLGNHYTAEFNVESVMRDGQPEAWHLENRQNGQRLYIGHPDRILQPGNYRYQIRYHTSRQLGFFDGHDELYWNVTGNGWTSPIDQASARVTLPIEVEASRVRLSAYTGSFRSTASNATSSSVDARTFEFVTTRPLKPYEGLTVVVEWPKGIITEPDWQQKARWFFTDNGAALVLLLGWIVCAAWYWHWWNKVGRDPDKGIIIPRFEPPKGLSPAASRYVLDMSFDRHAFTAAVISLAVKGHIRIDEKAKNLSLKKNDYTLFRLPKAGTRPLTPGETGVLGALLPAVGSSIEMDNENHAAFQAARSALKKELKKEHYGRLFQLNSVYLAPPIVISIVAALIALAFDSSPLIWIVWFVLTLSLHGFFAWLLRAPTPAGRQIMDEIEGFRMYLDTAEQDRLNQMKSPAMTPEVFEAFLPYAFALGVENHWCERFMREIPEELRQQSGYQPAWYSGHYHGMHALNHIGDSFSSGFSSAISAASTPPGSSSGGGGGGFSGGGGGGGGGGGW